MCRTWPRWSAEVVDTMSVREREVQDREGRWYSMRVRPYRTMDNKIDGAVMTFIDIDTAKRIHLELQREQTFTAAVLESAAALVMVTDTGGPHRPLQPRLPPAQRVLLRGGRGKARLGRARATRRN
jgi:hypothetical protein